MLCVFENIMKKRPGLAHLKIKADLSLAESSTNEQSILVNFSSFQKQILQKTVGFSGIQTQIVGVEGEHADHLTTTTAQQFELFLFFWTLLMNLLLGCTTGLNLAAYLGPVGALFKKKTRPATFGATF